jgi:hypothetical protein
MDSARLAAPEIDRLVWSVVTNVGPVHGPRIRAMAETYGLDGIMPLPQYAEFFVAGGLSRELALSRMPYLAPGVLEGWFEDLIAAGVIEAGPSGLVATSVGTALVGAVLDAESDLARRTWEGHEDAVAVVTRHARTVAAAASPDHRLAAAHRELPDPDDPYRTLLQRLVTLRYVRQHDHVRAWEEHGLTARQMVALTALWLGDTVHADDPELVSLVEDGYAKDDGAGLTEKGKIARDTIENETNRRAQETFDVLDEGAATEFLAAMRSLPGTPS